MSRRRGKYMEPFEVRVERLGKGGVGVGVAPDGAPVHVRGAPPGAVVAVRVYAKKRGTWHARRTALVEAPPGGVTPPCSAFGLCGGCVLQELDLADQRGHKHTLALDQVREGLGPLDGVGVHPPRGAQAAFGYRNKVELTFGQERFVSEAEHAAGADKSGSYLGFHAPGRWDRVVDVDRCWLITAAANALVSAAREALASSGLPCWNPRTHEGFWRHLVLRQGMATGELLVAIHTTTGERSAVAAMAAALQSVDLPEGHALAGVVWVVNDGVADVAHGATAEVWGREWLEERLAAVSFRLSPRSFFQTSTSGAEVLYDTIREAIGRRAHTLVDLYCGIGSIGLYLAGDFERIVGVEEVADAVADARENAVRNGVANAVYQAAKVEDALAILPDGGDHVLVVDPPRAGVHPRVAAALAGARSDTLIYVACNPASLGRDGAVLVAGGWRLTDLWTVDLFPQTGHIEVVGRFVRG